MPSRVPAAGRRLEVVPLHALAENERGVILRSNSVFGVFFFLACASPPWKALSLLFEADERGMANEKSASNFPELSRRLCSFD